MPKRLPARDISDNLLLPIRIVVPKYLPHLDISDTEYALHELSDDMEAMQSTIYQLQQNLKETSEQLQQAEEENRRLRAALPPGATVPLAETPGPGHGATEGATPTQVKQRTDSNSEELNRLKRTAPPSPAATNTRLKSRHTDKTDTSAERTNYKSGTRNRGTGSHGNQDRATAKGSGGRTGHHVRQGGDTLSESRMPSGAAGGGSAVTTRQDESSNGSSRHGNAESVAMDTNDAGSTEKLRSTNERENQRPRTANNSSSSKVDSASELANGLVGKHSTLTDACQKV